MYQAHCACSHSSRNSNRLTLMLAMPWAQRRHACFSEHFASIPFYFVVYSIYTRACTVVSYPFASVTYRDNRNLILYLVLITRIIEACWFDFNNKSLIKLCNVKQWISTAYHPQTDGETEWVNQELETYLGIFCKKNPEEWDRNLSITEFSYNERTHSATKWTPFFLMLGYKPTGIPIAFPKSNVPMVERRLAELLKIRDNARAAHELAWQAQSNRSKKNSPPFSKGDLVWLDGQHLNKGHTFPKMSPLWEGPFKIEEIMGPVTYKLKLPPQWKIHNVFHGKVLTL